MLAEPYSSLISIIIVILVGLFLSRRNWFSEDTTNTITKIILDVSIPLSIIACIQENVTKSTIADINIGILIPFLSIGLEYLISFILATVTHMPLNRKGLFVSMFSNPNTLFIGIPVNLAVFGSKSLPYAYIYYIVSTLFFNTVGTILLSQNNGEKLTLKKVKETLITPILISFTITIVLLMAEILLPDFITKSCSMIGSLATPLSLLYIGICLSKTSLKAMSFSLDIAGIFLGRFIVSPLITLFLGKILQTPEIAINVFVLQSFLPAMTSTPIFGARYNCDTQYATMGTTLTALSSLLIIPLYTKILF